MTGRSPLKRWAYSRVAHLVVPGQKGQIPARNARSRQSVLDSAHPRPERPDPGRLSGNWPFPDQKRGRGRGRARISRVLGFPVGRGDVFPVVEVGVVVASVLSFRRCDCFRRGGFKR